VTMARRLSEALLRFVHDSEHLGRNQREVLQEPQLGGCSLCGEVGDLPKLRSRL
jgi:hypothetical protein